MSHESPESSASPGSSELVVLNPATEEVLATVPAACAADVDAAVARAARAQPAWAALAPGDRARLLRRFAAVVDEHVEELARLEVRQAGHTVGNARWEAGNVRDLLDYAAGGVERLTGRQIPVAGGLDVTLLEPLGVVGVITPWNFPMPIAAWATAPALAAGNAVLLKPAETTPLTALRLAELALDAGLPLGTVPGAAGARTGGGGRARRAPGRRQDCLHRVHGRGPAGGRQGRRPPQTRHPRTRRQEPQHRLRRRRPGSRRGRHPHVLPGQLRPGLLRPHPHPGPAPRDRTGSSPCWPPRSRPSASATRPTRPPTWAR
ncbi:NAD/NADP-dependent betaine aldehyde dehydrogenase [Streptomyces tendae]